MEASYESLFRVWLVPCDIWFSWHSFLIRRTILRANPFQHLLRLIRLRIFHVYCAVVVCEWSNHLPVSTDATQLSSIALTGKSYLLSYMYPPSTRFNSLISLHALWQVCHPRPVLLSWLTHHTQHPQHTGKHRSYSLHSALHPREMGQFCFYSQRNGVCTDHILCCNLSFSHLRPRNALRLPFSLQDRPRTSQKCSVSWCLIKRTHSHTQICDQGAKNIHGRHKIELYMKHELIHWFYLSTPRRLSKKHWIWEKSKTEPNGVLVCPMIWPVVYISHVNSIC